jgi:predicted aldo/keto reductase-like oxidoreductase
MSSTRREFLATTVSIAAGAAAISAGAKIGWGQVVSPAGGAGEPALWDIPELKTPESTKEGDMLYRKLGRTNEKVSLLALGGYHFAGGTEADSTRLLRKAVDSGVNFMDNCWDYRDGQSEVRMGQALRDGYRKKVFLMTKLDGHTKEAATKQLNESLSRLQTDVIDLMQIHENIRMTDADAVFAKGGAIEVLVEAKKAGKIRYIGFTGHKDPDIHLHMLDVAKKNDFQFDSAQMPLNVMDAHFRSFARGVVPRAVKEGVGVLAMKTLGSAAILRSGAGVTAEQCLHYAMNLPTSTVIVGMDTMDHLDAGLAAVKSFKPFDQKALTDLLAKTKDLAAKGEYETFKTSSRFDGTANNPSWMG